jgi:hypothetical protein
MKAGLLNKRWVAIRTLNFLAFASLRLKLLNIECNYMWFLKRASNKANHLRNALKDISFRGTVLWSPL